MERKKFTPERGRCFSMGQATLSGLVAVNKERLEAAARNSGKRRGGKRRVRFLRARGFAEL